MPPVTGEGSRAQVYAVRGNALLFVFEEETEPKRFSLQLDFRKGSLIS